MTTATQPTPTRIIYGEEKVEYIRRDIVEQLLMAQRVENPEGIPEDLEFVLRRSVELAEEANG